MARLVLLCFHGFATIKVCENVLHQLEISTILYYFACECITYIYTGRIRNRTEICTVPPVFARRKTDSWTVHCFACLWCGNRANVWQTVLNLSATLSKWLNVYYRYIYMFLVLVSGLVFVVKTACSQRGEAKLSKSCLKCLCLYEFRVEGNLISNTVRWNRIPDGTNILNSRCKTRSL